MVQDIYTSKVSSPQHIYATSRLALATELEISYTHNVGLSCDVDLQLPVRGEE